MREKVKATRDEIEQELAQVIRAILRNNITSDALENTSSLEIKDIIVNLHLFERLGIAFEAVRALQGYTGYPRGFENTSIRENLSL